MNANEDEERRTADERGCTQIRRNKSTEATLEYHLRQSAVGFIPLVFAPIRVHSRLI
jgi:hypothetical protein